MGSPFFMGSGLFEAIFFAGFAITFVMAVAIFLFAMVKIARQQRKNNASPRLIVEAMVTAKREDCRRGPKGILHTRYFVTFEVESGDRMEFAVEEEEYGQIAQGDRGRLCFQGTRYLGFQWEQRNFPWQ